MHVKNLLERESRLYVTSLSYNFNDFDVTAISKSRSNKNKQSIIDLKLLKYQLNYQLVTHCCRLYTEPSFI